MYFLGSPVLFICIPHVPNKTDPTIYQNMDTFYAVKQFITNATTIRNEYSDPIVFWHSG